MQEKMQELPQSELRQRGDQSMNIRVTKTRVTLYIHEYCLHISSCEECQEMIKLFKLAKLRYVSKSVPLAFVSQSYVAVSL